MRWADELVLNKADLLEADDLAAGGMDVLRIKGVLALEGEPRRYVVQGVRALVDGELGEPWRGPRRSRLVVIGRRLDAQVLRTGFRACRTAEAVA